MSSAVQGLKSATFLYRGALALAFMLSALLFMAGGFRIDATSPWAWWSLILILSPFVGLMLRHLYRAKFDDPRNLALLGTAVGGLAGLHIVLMLVLA